MQLLIGLLPVAVKILAWFLDRSAASAEQKKAFFEWVKKAGQDFSSSKLLEYGDAQLKFLNEHPWEESK